MYQMDVKPQFERIKTFSLVCLAAWALSLSAFTVNLNTSPKMFDEYNAVVLANLNGNDDLSKIAAEKANGKPTYCKSRYYKALANGGQGCD